MQILVDEREPVIFEKCTEISKSISNSAIQIEHQVLLLGDIVFKTQEGQVLSIIERKTVADLLASIKDGRYVEQSYRLVNCSECSLHNIIYIIEGNVHTLKPTERQLVYSAMTSLHFFKGVSCMRTMSSTETAEWIMYTTDKLYRKIQKQPMATSSLSVTHDTPLPETVPTVQNYCSVVKKVKKENVTPENIGEIMLCQIPGISSITAVAIMKKFSSFMHLLESIKNDATCLQGLQYECNGKMRKISKAAIESIIHYYVAPHTPEVK